ncbi:7716_t:CDS:10 [Ambispora leptoticha]|uniref:GID complex catalytic subunit 2 n=1 Tax=Ambispora leptoticha TaxID=144679 RepID=A0A9N9BEP4_9GLOM|nr:7716_t:CDS:10 [Ambispora leptoticha]
MEPLLRENEIVANTQAALASHSVESVDKIINALKESIDHISASPENTSETLSLLSRHIKEISTQTIEEHKEYQAVLAKYGKVIDKKWRHDVTLASNPDAFEGKDKILQKTIALHFICQGKFDLGRTFMREAGLEISSELQAQFVKMYEILKAIREYNLEPALIWARAERERLEKRGSSLEFQLHRLHFIQHLRDQYLDESLRYAQLNFQYFNTQHFREIRRLMGSLAYINRLESSPYADLLSTEGWTNIQNTFATDFCSLLGFSRESPLFISVTVGATALPWLIKMSTIMKEKKNEWSQQNELPVEVPLTDDMRYHSIFACPVSKEQATEENPPMMMPCGHVICKESLNKLSKGQSSRFKCPYCPNESIPTQAMRTELKEVKIFDNYKSNCLRIFWFCISVSCVEAYKMQNIQHGYNGCTVCLLDG